MYPIDTETATDDHKFVNKNPDATPPVLATDLSAEWFNCIQEELLNILAGVGLSPDAANNAQVWDALKKIGINCVYAEASDDPEEPNAGDISSSGFDGSKVIFHDESDFSIEAMKTGSLLVVVPIWNAESSVDHITVSYNNNNIRIEKWNLYIGLVANGAIDDLAVLGARIPFLRNNGKGLTVGELVAGAVKSTKRYEASLVSFSYVDMLTIPDWELASNWEVGQVKRVCCVNASSSGSWVPYMYDNNSNASHAIFYPQMFCEFMCIGTRTVDDKTYAVLVTNGKA